MTNPSTEPLKNLLIRLIQAHDEEGLTAQEAAELMMETIHSNIYPYICNTDHSCGPECQGFRSPWCPADPEQKDKLWDMPDLPPRGELIGETLYLQQKGREVYREFYIALPEDEAANYIPFLLPICESWNNVSHSVMEKLKNSCLEKGSALLSLKEARQIEDMSQVLKKVFEEVPLLGQWSWESLEDAMGENRYFCSVSYIDCGTPYFWERVIQKVCGQSYQNKIPNPYFDPKNADKVQEYFVSQQEMEKMSYLELLGTRNQGRWYSSCDWTDCIKMRCRTDAEFMILLTRMENTVLPDLLTAEDHSDQSVKSEEQGTVVVLSEKESSDNYKLLALIFTAFEDFHIRTSGRWNKILNLDDKGLVWGTDYPGGGAGGSL